MNQMVRGRTRNVWSLLSKQSMQGNSINSRCYSNNLVEIEELLLSTIDDQR